METRYTSRSQNGLVQGKHTGLLIPSSLGWSAIAPNFQLQQISFSSVDNHTVKWILYSWLRSLFVLWLKVCSHMLPLHNVILHIYFIPWVKLSLIWPELFSFRRLCSDNKWICIYCLLCLSLWRPRCWSLAQQIHVITGWQERSVCSVMKHCNTIQSLCWPRCWSLTP